MCAVHGRLIESRGEMGVACEAVLLSIWQMSLVDVLMLNLLLALGSATVESGYAPWVSCEDEGGLGGRRNDCSIQTATHSVSRTVAVVERISKSYTVRGGSDVE
jgi:hypothetical protein